MMFDISLRNKVPNNDLMAVKPKRHCSGGINRWTSWKSKKNKYYISNISIFERIINLFRYGNIGVYTGNLILCIGRAINENFIVTARVIQNRSDSKSKIILRNNNKVRLNTTAENGIITVLYSTCTELIYQINHTGKDY